MKRKKLTRDSFAALKEHFPVISIEELAGIKGGSDCVLYCLAHIDGNRSAEWYGNMLMSFMGYSASGGATSGVQSSDIASLGSLGGLSVSLQYSRQPGTSSDVNAVNSFIAANLTAGASTLLVVGFADNNGNTVRHAIVATGTDQHGRITYYDPTFNRDSVMPSPLIYGVYSVSSSSNGSSGSSGGYYDSGGYIYSW
jgi:hypothetical protein